MGSQGTLARRARAIAIEHLAAPPTGEPHEIALAAAAREPAVCERVTQQMRVEPVAEPRLAPSLSDDLRDSAVGQPALSADPQPWHLGMGRALSHPDIPIEGANRLGADRDDPLSSPFPEDSQDAPIEVDVVGGFVGGHVAKTGYLC